MSTASPLHEGTRVWVEAAQTHYLWQASWR
jgi:hypothetical protein